MISFGLLKHESFYSTNITTIFKIYVYKANFVIIYDNSYMLINYCL